MTNEFTPEELKQRIKEQLFPSLLRSEERKRAWLEQVWPTEAEVKEYWDLNEEVSEQ